MPVNSGAKRAKLKREELSMRRYLGNCIIGSQWLSGRGGSLECVELARKSSRSQLVANQGRNNKRKKEGQERTERKRL